jgi:cobalt-zinc-cadmium resistance protein CzcA
MVCALLPLFTMKGPEGQIFGPMADTYAFALGGALLLALTVSPVLCCLFLKNLKPTRDNFLVRGLKAAYIWQLQIMLKVRWLAVAGFVVLIAVTGYTAANMGREFMPELEEGNLWIRGTFPLNISFEEVAARTREVRGLLRRYPEVETIVSQVGRPDDGTDPTGYYNVEINVPLLPAAAWPTPPRHLRPRTKEELVRSMNEDLDLHFPGVNWDFSQVIRDNVMEALSGVKGENSIKIFGPDLDKLEELAEQVKVAIAKVRGIENAGVFHIQGQSNLEFPIDRQKCARWNVSAVDVQNVIQAAVGGKALTQMTEGGKTFDVTIRFPERLRNHEQAILDIPVEVTNNQVRPGVSPGQSATMTTGGGAGLSPIGTSISPPSLTGSAGNSPSLPNLVPQRRLGDLVTPLVESEQAGSTGQFIKPGASTIYREQGQRLIAVKFGVRGRDLASTVAEAQAKVAPLLQPPYRTEWSGEFQEMEEAEGRLVKVFGLSLVLILVLLYMAFRSLLDAAVVFGNIVVMAMGGVWALRLMDLNFNISAAVGFISILGVAVMNGLIMISSFNRLRARGVPLHEAIVTGVEHRVRPLMMTLLTAILGLLPAAFSTRIGAQSQRPLAIVVVGGMLMMLLFMNLLPVLYSFYGRRQPPVGAADMAH